MNSSLSHASTFAVTWDLMFVVMLGISVLLCAAVWFLIVFLSLKYRRGSKADRSHPPKRPAIPELTLCAVMFVLGLGLFLWSARFFYQMYQSPRNAIEIDVIAKQWMWVFHSPGAEAKSQDQINAFKVPLGRPVRLVMTSEDVIHSLFIPAFRVKQDVLPGRYTSMWFEANRLGKFEILCSQYCGLDHSAMRAVVEVVTPEEYARSQVPDQDGAGERLMIQKGCTSCHDAPSGDKIGPSLHGLYLSQVRLRGGKSVTADENYLRRAILSPNSEIVEGYSETMPTFQGQLSEAELLSILNYIKDQVKK